MWTNRIVTDWTCANISQRGIYIALSLLFFLHILTAEAAANNFVESRLRLNDMLKELRVNEEKKDVSNMSEKVLKNILAPNPPERKLTYKQKIKEAALKKLRNES